MNMDELARLRHAFTAVLPDARPRADCPPAGRIWEGVRGELGPKEFRKLIHHLASCPICTEAWQLAERLEDVEGELEEETPPRKPSASWHRGFWVAGTAAAAAVFLTVSLEVQDWRNQAPAHRAPASDRGDQTPTNDEIKLLNEGPVLRDGLVLRWQGPKDAVYYDLRVSLAVEPGRTLVAKAGIKELEFQVPSETLAELVPGDVLLISLAAFHPIEGRLRIATFSRACPMNAIALGAFLLLTVVVRPVNGQISFGECEARLDAEPDSERPAECFYSLARSHGDHAGVARRLAKHIEAYPGSPWLHYYRGHVLRLSNRCTNDAGQAYRDAIQGFIVVGDIDGESYARSKLIWFLASCRRFTEAELELPAAESVAQTSTDSFAYPSFQLAHIGLQISSGGDLEAVHRQLRELWETAHLPVLDSHPRIWRFRSSVLERLGAVTWDLGKYDEAQYWYQTSRDRAAEIGDRRGVVMADCGIVLAKMAHKLPTEPNREEILAGLQAVLQAAVGAAQHDVEARARLQIAKMEGGPEAENHLQRCQQQAGGTSLRRGCKLALASLRLEDDPAAALELLAEVYAEGLFESDDPRALIDGWDDHLRILWQTHSREEAVAGAEQILGAIENLRNPQTGMARARILDAWSEAYYSVSGLLLSDATSDDDMRRAFAVMERLRAQELREILFLSGGTAPQLPPPPPDLMDQIVVALGKDEAMLSFQLFVDQNYYRRFAGGAWVLVLTREGARVHQLDLDRAEAEPMIETLIGGQWDDPHFMWTLVDLHEKLLRPALDHLPPGIERLTLIPDGILHLLPFAALRPASGAPSLGERYELTSQPSASLWLGWKKNEGLGLEPATLVFADPELSSVPAAPAVARSGPRGGALGPLPSARGEGQKAVDHLRGSSRLLQGAEASEYFLKQTDLRPFGLLHFATHAVADSERPSSSGVLITGGYGFEDGWLQPNEIAELDLDGKVVILSTCNSASGVWLQGEGVMSLAWAFFQAGAHAVVGTLRPLRDEHGERFFDDFYRHLSQGASLRKALAATQREWAANNRPMATWASVVLLGNGDLRPVPGGIKNSLLLRDWATITISILLAGSLGFFLWRRSSLSDREHLRLFRR